MNPKFPQASLIAEGEIKRGVIAQNPDYTSKLDGMPSYGFNMLGGSYSDHSTKNNSGLMEGSIHGLEEVGWESPLRCDELPKPRDPGKVGW